MRKKILTQLRVLLITVFSIGLIWSCMEEKPEIIIPVNIPHEVIPIEAMAPDTIIFKTNDSIIIKLKTNPYYLLNQDGVSIGLCTPDTSDYNKAEIRNPQLNLKDSIWSITVIFKPGISNGDVVCIKVTEDTKTMLSKPIVLKKFLHYIETSASDTVTFMSRDTLVVGLKSTPVNWLGKDGVSVQLITPDGQEYENAYIKSKELGSDSVWNIVMQLKQEAHTGDAFSIKVSDCDTTILTKPIFLKKFVFNMETLSPDTIVFNEGDNAILNVRTTPIDLLFRDSVKIKFFDKSGHPYQFATVNNKVLSEDSIWSVYIRMEYGMKSGDVIVAGIDYKDTLLSSAPVVLKMIPKPEPKHYSLNIVSDSISAYEAGGQATIYFRTTPWNLLLDDSTTVFSLTDKLGNAANSLFNLESRVFMPDSSWQIKLTVKDPAASSSFITATIANSDTTMLSTPVELKKVSFGMQSVRTGNDLLMNYNHGNGTYSYYLPEVTDLTSQRFLFTHNGHKVTLDGNVLNDNVYNVIDASKPFTVSLWCYDLHKEYTIKVSYCYVKIVSAGISAYEGSNASTVRVRTVPWNILQTNADASLTLTDSLGNSVDGLISISSREFMPDSSWTYQLKVLDNSVSSSIVSFALSIPDTTVLSSRVELKKVAFKMKSVKTGNSLSMDYKNGTYSYCLPTTTDFSTQKFLFSHNGDSITVGNKKLKENVYNTLDVNTPLTVTVWLYDLHKDYTIKLYNTGLPIVRINTNGQSVTRRDTWVDNNTMRIEWPDGTVDYEGTLSLKGRGNGTWTETNKKPYALKLDEKAKILGMHKQKRWCLLANYKDRTLLRNDAALWLSRQTDMPYTVSGQFVELVWNGEHMGNYYLCEQIRIDNNRVDIAEPNLNDPEKGGMLILIDDFLDYNSSDRYDKSPMVGFRSTGASNRYKLPYILKDPDEDEDGHLLTSSSPTYQYLFNYVKEMEDAIYGMKANGGDNSIVKKYLDYDRAIDYVLIQEITMNHDSYNTWPKAGPHSGYLYKDSCGLLCYGPVWDFDYHTFTLYSDAAYSYGGSSNTENPRLRQWELLKMDNKGNNKYYFADLAKYDSEFRRRLLERWNKYKNVWKEEFPAYIDQMAEYIRLSESYNDTRWAENKNLTNYKQNGDYNLTFQQAVDALKTAFQKRWEWMDQNLKNLPN